jgi:acyl-CoA synthetase (NDP forming)
MNERNTETAAFLGKILSNGGNTLTEAESKSLLSRYNIPVVTEIAAATA